MFDKFIPDLMCDTIYDIDIQALTSRGIRGVALDIDNTLVTYDDPEPTPEVLRWLGELEENGITASFVSNNKAERVSRFNASLGFFAAPDSGKPSVREYKNAMVHMGTDEKSTAVIGDQIFTDVYAAHRLGLYCVMVKPIKDKRSLFFRFKRALEKPFLRAYRRRVK